MKSTLRKGLILVSVASSLVLGCELIVDFDRTKIPVEGTDASPADGSVAEGGGTDSSTDAPSEASEAGDADASTDASDAADADDAG